MRWLPCSPVLSFTGGGDVTEAELRTLFQQEMIVRGVMIPYVAPSFSHGKAEVDRTVEAASGAFGILRRVLDGEPLDKHLTGRVIKPVFRRYNFDR